MKDRSEFLIRSLREEDYPFILELNAKNVEVLAPMDMEKLRDFAKYAELFLVAESEGRPAAFLIALREGVSAYNSENYRWFSRCCPRFLYVDRIVIDEPFRSRGLGRQLYQTVFSHAKAMGAPSVTAEIDTVPYNAASLAFHKAMGFCEVGTQWVRDNTIQVSLQAAAVR